MLPITYRKLKYLESNGGQYIDTLVNCTSELTFELELCSTNQTGSQAFIGATSENRSSFFGIASNAFRFVWGERDGTSQTLDSLYHKFKVDGGKMYFDENEVGAVGSQYSGTSVYLFARNYSQTFYSYMRLKYCKMYQNGILVRDFVPALRKSDNVPGLYDLVNNVFYVNKASGSFTYEVDNSVYIKINGTWKPTTLFLKVNGAWKEGNIRIKANNAWKGVS